jgi:hypothetical protein
MATMSRTKRVLLGSSTLALLCGACTPDEDLGVRTDIFGTVSLEARRTQNAATTPFIDTETVVVEVTMGQCLDDFFSSNPEWAADGSKGSQVADAWLDRLCDKLVFNDSFKCEPTGHEWLAGAGEGGRGKLQVTYQALHPDLENFDIVVGPLPNEGFAGCEPTVTVGTDSANGFAGDKLVWQIDPVFAPMAWEGSTVTTKTGSAEAPKIFVERVD